MKIDPKLMSLAILDFKDLLDRELKSYFYIIMSISIINMYTAEIHKGDQPKIPLSSKILKNPPLSSEPGPPLRRRAKPAGKFLGYFEELSGKFSVIFGLITINN